MVSDIISLPSERGGMYIVLQPENYTIEETTIWSFPDRGNWATHSGDYRGNWSPYVPRNLIIRYSSPGDWVLDQFVGSGTTLIEAKLLNRNAIGIDINDKPISISKKNLDFEYDGMSKILVRKGDATRLDYIKDDSIDLICTHPPYADIIHYSDNNKEDLSLLSMEAFLDKIKMVANESFRVLKRGKICAFMMGDIRRKGNVIPLGFDTMQAFLDAGFKNKEIIIKEQHNCQSTDYWMNKNRKFLMLAHEYIFVFMK